MWKAESSKNGNIYALFRNKEIKYKTKASAKWVKPLGTKGVGTLYILQYYNFKKWYI